MILRAGARGPAWFLTQMLRCHPLQLAADKLNVDLAARFKPLPEVPSHVLHDQIMSFMLGNRYVATKQNLEI